MVSSLCILARRTSLTETTYRATCWYENSGNRGCTSANNAYSTTVFETKGGDFVSIGASWTRGLAIHPVGEPSDAIPHCPPLRRNADCVPFHAYTQLPA